MILLFPWCVYSETGLKGLSGSFAHTQCVYNTSQSYDVKESGAAINKILNEHCKHLPKKSASKQWVYVGISASSKYWS